MALASSGKFQTECDCDVNERWRPGIEYEVNSLVVHTNPNTSLLSLYRAKGDYINGKKLYLDSSNDEPGKSIHWELVCECEEIGFTPTPIPTPTPNTTPTPTRKYPTPTPTPTPQYRCDDYPVWDKNKLVPPGETHYNYKDRVSYNGKVYEVRDVHGVEKNDIPGISNHWIYLFDCAECLCAPTDYTTWVINENLTEFSEGKTNGFAQNVKLSFNKNEFDYGNGVILKLKLENSNIIGDVLINGVSLPFEGVNIYASFNGICYHAKIRPLGQQYEYELKIKSFPDICPTPSPDSNYICGEGFSNIYVTDGKTGQHEQKYGFSAEKFESGGKIYHGDLIISNLNEAMVYASVVYKNNDTSEEPFGVILTVGKFLNNKNYIVYESPDGSCWRGNVQPNGKNIILFRVF